MTRLSTLAFFLLSSAPALADAPKVVTDIAPIHSLVAQVMGNLGQPMLLVDPGASPHGYALKPSQAAALSKADLVIWMGAPLTPWLADPLQALAPQARQISLLEVPGTTTHDYREEVVFAPDHEEGHEDGHSDAHHDAHVDDHGHDDHGAEHAEKHGDDHGEDHSEDHGDDHADDHGHGHGHEGVDPHAWLDPENARNWLTHIAEELAIADAENADTYRANASDAAQSLATLSAEIAAQLEPLESRPFVVYHDAYQYFEQRFHLTNRGAIAESDAAAPSPARIAELQQAIADQGIACIFSEPQFNSGLVDTVFEGATGKMAEIDPLGSRLSPGSDLYPEMLRALSGEIVDCLR